MRILPKKYWKYFAIGVVFAWTLLIFAWGELPEERMQLSFMDVGQGDAILIQTPEGHNVLVDGGPKSKVLEELSDMLAFFNRQIDLMILTHPHADHLEGLVEVLKRYEVGAVLLTGVAYDNYYYDEFLRDLAVLQETDEIDIYVARAEEDYRVGSVYFDVLYPIESLAGRRINNLNNSSIVMRVSGPWESRILLSGDCEAECENEILEAGFELTSEIFKAGHHGSKTASSYEFVRAIEPDVAVIQCGEGNKFRHPHGETLRTFYRLGVHEIYRTDLDGRVEF
jgi:competence protein ComEC